MTKVEQLFQKHEYINTFLYADYCYPDLNLKDLTVILTNLKAIVSECGEAASKASEAAKLLSESYYNNSEDIYEDSQYFGVAARCLEEIAKNIRSLQSSFVKRSEQSHYFDLIQAYIDFSKKYGNVALYCNYPSYDAADNPLPYGKWIKFSGDSTVFEHGANTRESYDAYIKEQKSKSTDPESVSDGKKPESKLKLKGIDHGSFSDEDFSHWVSLDDAHASMIIPLKFYPTIKKMLEDDNVYVTEHIKQ
jgi:hypothetical protein